MATRQDSVDVSQEPPPPYEPFDAPSSPNAPVTSHSGSAVPSSTAAVSAVNPFMSPSETEPTTGVSTSNLVPNVPVEPVTAARPALPPRTSISAGSVSSVSGSTLASATTRVSPTVSSQSPSRPSTSTSLATTSPTPSTSSSSRFRPPSGPPPLRTTASSSSSRPRLQDQYRPTTAPTPGQPLLRKGKLLIYPQNWSGCTKCNDTGYKQGDPSNPCKKCWDKYGKTYTSAVSYSVGLNDASSHLQKPLPMRVQAGIARPPVEASHSSYSQSSGSGGYAGGGRPSSYASGYQAPAHPPAGHVPLQSRPTRSSNRSEESPDAETVGSRMADVPPNYQDASNVPQEERLPSQYVPPAMPPPGSAGSSTFRPPQAPPHMSPGTNYQGHQGGYQHPFSPPGPYGPHSYGPQHGPPFGGGFSSYPGGSNPHLLVGHYGMRAPPGALVVLPGDPRIGGRLCYECGGRGETESFWFGDETCLRCRGSGRIH